MAADDETQPRPGTYADLARRIERMEVKHEDLAKEVAGLTATTGQVVLNQKHAEDINELRFKSLDTAVGLIGTDLKGFMARVEGILSGDIQTASSRQGLAVIEDYNAWRKEVDARLDASDTREAGRKGVLSALSGAKGIILMVAAILSPIVAAIGIIVTRP